MSIDSLPSLIELWTEYKKIELTGKRTKRALDLEVLIHQKQKILSTGAYDFNARWEKNETMGKSTVEGPPMDARPEATNVPPQANFTVEQAKEKIGENDCAILDDCIGWAEARMIYMAHVADVINPANKTNVARRGQCINIAIAEFNRRKAEE